MEIAKITEIRNLFTRFDKEKRPYIFDMYYSSPGSDAMVNRVDRGDKYTGVEKFQELIDDLIENFNPDIVSVTAYKSERSKGNINSWSIKVGKDVDDVKFQRLAQHPPQAASNTPETTQPQTEEFGFAGLSGMDGVQRFMGMQGEIMNKDLEIRILTSDKDRIKSELSTLKVDFEKLEKDYDKLYRDAEKLEEFAEKAKKYIPGENDQTLAGMKVTELLSAVGTKVVTNIATKNPDTTARILGISTADLGSLFNDNTEEKPAIEKAPAASNLSPEQKAHLDTCDQIYDICQALKPELLVKIIKYFKFINATEGNIDLIDNFINKQQNN